MTRTRYLIKPQWGCAPFIVWAESPDLALRYAAEWLGMPHPIDAVALRYLSHDVLSCMYDASDTTKHHTQQGPHA